MHFFLSLIYLLEKKIELMNHSVREEIIIQLENVFTSQVVSSFDDMDLKEELLRGIYAYGFEKPSAIQQRAIMPCIEGHDVIAQAQSGKIY